MSRKHDSRGTSRRRFLRASALGAASVALPILPSLTSRGGAQDGAFPKRLVVFFSGNGTIPTAWDPPSDGGFITEMSPILSPLEPHRNKLMVVAGVNTEAGKRAYQPKGGFHGHERGLGCILTGRPLNLGPMVEGSGYGSGISVDQFLADRFGDETSLRSIHAGLVSRRHGSGHFNRNVLSYAGDSLPIFSESDGSVLFSTIFGDGAGDASAYQRIRDRRQSVLDFVQGDLARLETRISAEDRLRIAEHHTAFRTLERQLGESLPTCEAPALSEPGGWMDVRNMDAIAEFQIQQTVQALACDRTRVAAIQYGTGLGGLNLQPIGYDDSWHSLSHDSYDDATSVRKLTEYNTYIASKFARLLELMDGRPEGGGTMLDNSVVLWVNELRRGNTHTYDNTPIVMAGGGAGFFKTGGRYIDVGGRANNDLLISICRAFGHDDVNEFGLPELSTGPIEQLHV